MGLKDAMEKMKYDKRMIEINLQSGDLKPEDLKKHLEQLPDQQNQADTVVFGNLGSSNGAATDNNSLN